ncbi:unnamed protein product [Ectocarpus sp. 8 AP-2014]
MGAGLCVWVKSGRHALSGSRNRLHAWIFRSTAELKRTSDCARKKKRERGDSSTLANAHCMYPGRRNNATVSHDQCFRLYGRGCLPLATRLTTYGLVWHRHTSCGRVERTASVMMIKRRGVAQLLIHVCIEAVSGVLVFERCG